MEEHIVEVKINYRPAYNDYLVNMECGSPVFIQRDHRGDAERKREETCQFAVGERSMARKILRKLKRAQKQYNKITERSKQPSAFERYNLTHKIGNTL